MIQTVVIAADREVREGLQRLLESEGDIHVLASGSGLSERFPHRPVTVLGPDVRGTLAEWKDLFDAGAVVAVVAVPGWRSYPIAVRQVPMDLNGVSLRRTVREVTRPDSDPCHSPRPLRGTLPIFLICL